MRSAVLCAGVLAIAISTAGDAQSPPPGRAVNPNYLVNVDFVATPAGDFPSTIDMLDGVMNVVSVNGRNMLRASATSSFLIHLTQVLPADFTIEADVIPKVDANPADIGFEGTSVINQGTTSANILWHSQSLQVVGGATDNFETRFPETFASTLAGVLTRVTVVVEGATIKVFTNGRLMSTLPNRKFMRGPVLRVFLGGQDDGTAAVYLAALRVTPSALSATQVAGNPLPPPPGGPGTSNVTTPPSGTSPAPNAGPAIHPPAPKSTTSNPATLVFQVGLRQGWGANISWPSFGGAVQYLLERRESGKAFSPIGTFPADPTGGFKADIALRNATHYDYQLTAVDANGTTLATSATQGIDTPGQYPTITGLTASVGASVASVVHNGQAVNAQASLVTYTWDASQLIGQQFGTLDHIIKDPATGQSTVVQQTNSPFTAQSGGMLAVEAGTSARFCVAVILDPADATQLASPTCLTISMPSAPRTSTTNTKVTNALDDGPAPTLTLTPTSGGIKVSYTAVPGGAQYSVCRESPPGSACTSVGLGVVSVLGNNIWAFDLGLPPTAYAYRVTATQPNGHYGESATVTAVAGVLPPPQNVRVSSASVSPYQVVLEWDPVQYEDYSGPKTITTYQVSGGAFATTRTVNGTTTSAPLVGTMAQYGWRVSAVLPTPNGNALTSADATVAYTTKYRIVALGLWAERDTKDASLFDGAGDEVYLATAVNVTNRALSSNVVTMSMTSTFGDVAGRPNRVRAGTLTPTGGITLGTAIPSPLDLTAPINVAPPRFPFVVWEGPLDDQAMTVVHASLWEEGSTTNPYLGWLRVVSLAARSGYANGWSRTLQQIQTLRDGDNLGPQAGSQAGVCTSDVLLRTSIEQCMPNETRPIGLQTTSSSSWWFFNDMFVVLTHSAIEKALLSAPVTNTVLGQPTPVQQVPGLVVVEFRDSQSAPPFGYGVYRLYLKVERVP